MLNDVSWDYENRQPDGTFYSHAIANVLSGSLPSSTQTTPQGVSETQEPQANPNIKIINGRSVVAVRGKFKTILLNNFESTLRVVCKLFKLKLKPNSHAECD